MLYYIPPTSACCNVKANLKQIHWQYREGDALERSCRVWRHIVGWFFCSFVIKELLLGVFTVRHRPRFCKGMNRKEWGLKPLEVFCRWSADVQTVDSLNDVEACGKEVTIISAGVRQSGDASGTLRYLHF